jgi:hypothetical protein
MTPTPDPDIGPLMDGVQAGATSNALNPVAKGFLGALP